MNRGRRHVLVTGATSGLGYAISRYLVAAGVHVFVGYRKAADAARLQQDFGPQVTPLRIDITDQAQLEAAAATMAEVTAVGLQGVVNNAGIAIAGPLEVLDDDAIVRQFDVNVVGAIRTTAAMLPLLRRGSGRVIHISSAAASFALPFVGPYAASKAAIDRIADAMRRELRPQGIPVALIRPGRMSTAIFDRAESAARERFEAADPAQRTRYEPTLRKLQALMHRSQASRRSPDQVARVVDHALFSRWPKRRYNVGIDAKLADQVGKWVPAAISDRVVGWFLKP